MSGLEAKACDGGPAGQLDGKRPLLIGRAPAFVRVLHLIGRLASCDVPVLLRGETGTGKEVAARAVHYLGSRREMPFIPVNCGALPDTLIESELFGHVHGAFTDARSAQTGLVAQAHGGTLFLDEVDTLSAKAQVALLRYLQDGSYRPLGGRSGLVSSARIVAATNADLVARIAQGCFREDLYFRLSVLPLDMPALRDRPGDIALLAESFVDGLKKKHGSGPSAISHESTALLERYRWPGNVRELQNVLQRAFLLADSDCIRITPQSLGLAGRVDDGPLGSFKSARARALETFERSFVCQALVESGGNVSLAARRVGKERRSFGRLMKKHAIDKSTFATQ